MQTDWTYQTTTFDYLTSTGFIGVLDERKTSQFEWEKNIAKMVHIIYRNETQIES